MPAETTSTTHYMGETDTLPDFASVLRDGNGAPVDLVQATEIMFKIRRYGQADAPTLGGVAARDPVIPGRVVYLWPVDQPLVAGVYECQWRVTWPGAQQAHFPNRGFDVLYVSPVLPEPA